MPGAGFLKLGVACILVNLQYIHLSFRKESLHCLSLRSPVQREKFKLHNSRDLPEALPGLVFGTPLPRSLRFSHTPLCPMACYTEAYDHSDSFTLNTLSFLFFFFPITIPTAITGKRCLLPDPAQVIPFLWSLPCSTSGRITFLLFPPHPILETTVTALSRCMWVIYYTLLSFWLICELVKSKNPTSFCPCGTGLST